MPFLQPADANICIIKEQGTQAVLTQPLAINSQLPPTINSRINANGFNDR